MTGEALLEFDCVKGNISCSLGTDARVRVWTIGNVVEVTGDAGRVVSFDGEVRFHLWTGPDVHANTSDLYLRAAQFQGLPVEYIEAAPPFDANDEGCDD